MINKEIDPARKFSNTIIAFIIFDVFIENIFWNIIHNLRKNCFTYIHIKLIYLVQYEKKNCNNVYRSEIYNFDFKSIFVKYSVTIN